MTRLPARVTSPTVMVTESDSRVKIGTQRICLPVSPAARGVSRVLVLTPGHESPPPARLSGLGRLGPGRGGRISRESFSRVRVPPGPGDSGTHWQAEYESL